MRRRARTILTLLGLGLGVALVVAITSLSNGLDRAQKKTLNPLGGIGTDLTVTLRRSRTRAAASAARRGGRGGGNRDLIQANQSVITDLSKLGKPGTHFVHDFFLPGTQLTFQQSAAKQIAAIDGVAQVTQGLTLLAEHQEGVVPKIVAKLKTGGQTFQIRRQPAARRRRRSSAAMQACFAKLSPHGGDTGGSNSGGDGTRLGGGGGGGGASAAAAASTAARSRSACRRACASSARTFTTPTQTLQQVLEPAADEHQDDRATRSAASTRRTRRWASSPRRRSRRAASSPQPAAREALVSAPTPPSTALKVGSKLDLNGTSFTVVGLVSPPLGGQSADVYLPLTAAADAREPEGPRERRARPRREQRLGRRRCRRRSRPRCRRRRSRARRTSPTRSAARSSTRRTCRNDLGLALSIVAAAAAFLLAVAARALVGRQARPRARHAEGARLDATAWSSARSPASRSPRASSAASSAIALGILAALAIDAFGPTLTASSTVERRHALRRQPRRGPHRDEQGVARRTDRLRRSSCSGSGSPSLGGLVAGAAGALRAARLRPADALRQVD